MSNGDNGNRDNGDRDNGDRDDQGQVTGNDDGKYGELPKMEIRMGGDPVTEPETPPDGAQAEPVPNFPATSGTGPGIAETGLQATGIVETALDLSPVTSAEAVAATERLRTAKGQTGRARGRETAAAAVSDAATAVAERTEIPPSPVLETTAQKRYAKAVTLWLIAAVVGGAAALLAWHPGAVGTQNKAFVNSGETSQVMSQLTTLACLPFNYTWQTITEDMQSAGDALVGQAKDEYIRTAETNRSIVVQRQADSACQVDHLALADLTKNEATAIGVLIIQVSTGGKLSESLMPRMQFTLERVGDDWKIAAVSDVK